MAKNLARVDIVTVCSEDHPFQNCRAALFTPLIE